MTSLYSPGIPTYLQEFDWGPGKTVVLVIMMFDRVNAWTKRIFEKGKLRESFKYYNADFFRLGGTPPPLSGKIRKLVLERLPY